jgi:hypothetical protein
VHLITHQNKPYALKVFNSVHGKRTLLSGKAPIVQEYEILSRLKGDRNIVKCLKFIDNGTLEEEPNSEGVREKLRE